MRAALIGGALFAAAPTFANVEEPSALAAYARARAADQVGALDRASKGYAAALALAPDNEVLANRALGQAIAAGDRALALQAARLLDRAGKLPPDGRLLLVGEALRAKKWKDARTQIELIEKDEIFSFIGPLLRAWLAEGSGKGDPVAILKGATGNALAEAYAAEHRPLLLLAKGRTKEALPGLEPLHLDETIRAQRLRIAAAAALVRRGARAEALALLRSDAPALAEARRRIEAGKAPGPELRGAAAGTAELLLRIALDLNGQEMPQLALSFARLATLLDPASSVAWLVAADLLVAQRRYDAALAALDSVAAADLFAAHAIDRRVATLADADRSEEALAAARSAAERAPSLVESWIRLGDVLARAERFGEAADAYGKAVALAAGGAASPQPRWGLLLFHGSALTQAGRWAEGKAALQEAHRLAPDEAVVLNYLGYSQLERRENLAEAERMIAEASRLQPNDAAITDSLGWAFYVRGNLPKAVELLERAAQGEPSDPAINEHLGDAYYSAGRRFEARYAWQAALVYAQGAAATRLKAKIERGLTPDLAAP